MIVLKCCRCGSTDLTYNSEDEDTVFCKGCNGVMDIDLECNLEEIKENKEEKCNACGGSGHYKDGNCGWCKGTGLESLD